MEQQIVREDIEKHCHHHHKFCCIKCISWSAIIAGALVAVGLGFLVNLFGISIGLSAFKTSQEGIKALAIGGYFGFLVGSIVIMFVAGWVAGYLGRGNCMQRELGALYGFSTWTLALIIAVLMAGQLTEFTAHSNSALDYSVSYNSYNLTASKNAEAPLAYRGNNAETHSPSNTIMINEEKATHLVGLSLLLTFILFFAGAIASCFGGYFGLSRCTKDKEGHLVNR